MNDIVKMINDSIDLNNDTEYFALPALSQSSIKQYEKSPVDYWKISPFNECKEEFTPTDATIFGNLAHCILLEEHKFDEMFIIEQWSTKTRNSAGYESLRDKYDKAGDKRFLVKQTEVDRAKRMKKALLKSPFIKGLLNGLNAETPIVWLHEETQSLMKCKIDGLKKNASGEYIVFDYKTTGKFSEKMSVTKEGWAIQCAVIKQAVKAKFGKIPSKYIYVIQSSAENDHNKYMAIEISLDTVDTTEIEVNQYIREIGERHQLVQDGIDPDLAFCHSLSAYKPILKHGNYHHREYWQSFDNWVHETGSTDRAEFENHRNY